MGITGLPDRVLERRVGESLSLSMVYFAADGPRMTGIPDDGQARLRARLSIPTTTIGGRSLGTPTVETFVQGGPTITRADTAAVVDRRFPFFDRNNSDRPEIIVKLTWASLPDITGGAPQLQVCAPFSSDEIEIGRQVGGVWSALTGFGVPPCFTLKAQSNIVKIQSGDVAAGEISRSSGSLQFTSPNGQILVNGQAWTDCGALNALPGTCPQAVISDTELRNRLSAQFAAAAKVAEEVAIIGRVGLNPAAFLIGAQSSWLNPRGEVLYLNGSVNLAGATITGKKMLIAQGDINVVGQIIAPGTTQVALVSLNGDINIRTPRFEGAALAVGAGHQITVAGGGTVIKGLLAAPTIIFSTPAVPSETLATLDYDARYQRGELLGLSAILRPLVTEPSL